ncbi:MAG: aminotransferase class V-fold PLP-dependent enzyme, partial [bacterium]
MPIDAPPSLLANGNPSHGGLADAGLTYGDLASLFPLDRSYTFLNHGSFGSTPHELLAEQDRVRREVEARPIEMLGRRMDTLLASARESVARFVGTSPDRLGFVTNATEGVHAVLRSMSWRAGDEVVCIDHVYNAMRQSLRRLAQEFGIVVREVTVPLPVASADDFVAPVVAAFGERTRLLLIDHITSPTALVVPVERLGQEAKRRGIRVLIDGAHAPGSIALAIDRIPCDAYTGNLHKWCCAPKGCGIVVASPEFASELRPIATSHRYGEGLTREFDWQGTRDMTPWLVAPAAIRFFERFGWDRVRRHNHDFAAWTHRELVRRWSVAPLSPLDGSMLAAMAAVPVP